MSLAKTQATLARLFTDSTARADFARDPVAAMIGLDRDEAETLAAIDANEIARFANGLLAKRRQDVEKWLPLTARALGPDFEPLLRATLAEPPPGACADALALAASLRAAKAPRWIGALAVYEGEFLRAWGPRAFFAVRVFRWPIARIAARLGIGEPVGEVSAALTLAVWARPRGGRLRHLWRTLG